MAVGKGSSSSKRVRFLSSKNTKKGRVDKQKTLTPQGVRNFWAEAYVELQLKVAGGFLTTCNLGKPDTLQL